MLHVSDSSCALYYKAVAMLSYYNKRNAHFDVQELLLPIWTERHEIWQEYGEALGA